MTLLDKTKKAAMALSACFLLANSALVTAEQTEDVNTEKKAKHGHKMKHGKQHDLMKTMRHLQLTDEQSVQVKAILQTSRDEGASHHEQMKSFKQAIQGITKAEFFDEAAFTQLHAENQALFAEIALSKAKSMHAIYQVLTPEQQAKWQKHANKMKGKRGEGKKGQGI